MTTIFRIADAQFFIINKIAQNHAKQQAFAKAEQAQQTARLTVVLVESRQESRSPKLSLRLTTLKKLKKTKDDEADTNIANLLVPLKQLRLGKSRSPSPQRVFHCDPKLARSPKLALPRRERPSESKVESGSIRVQQKLLTFAKLKSKPKKSEVLHFDVLSPPSKKRDSEKQHLLDGKAKKGLKTKKKKKVASDKNDSSTKEENTLQFSDIKRLKDASLSLRDQIHKTTLKHGSRKASKKASLPDQSSLLKKSKRLKMSLFDILEASAILIQKHVRGYLCRQRLGRFLQSFLESAHSEGILAENDYSDNITPPPSRGVLIKPLTSDHSHSSSLMHGRRHRTEGKDRSLKEISLGHWQRYDLKTEYSAQSNAVIEDQPREVVVKRPTRTVDAAMQSDPIEASRPVTAESRGSRAAADRVIQKKSKESLAVATPKKFSTVACQVSARVAERPAKSPAVTICSPIIIEKAVPTRIVAPSSSRACLEKLAKDEYKKWSQVDQLLARMNNCLGQGRSKDLSDMFSKIEALANQSKFSLKNKFKVQGSSLSLLSLSKTPTVQSLLQQANKTGAQQSRGEIAKRDLKSTKSIGSSPFASPLISKLQNLTMEKWPDVPDIQKSITLQDGKSSENPLFESIDEKLDKIIRKEQRAAGSSLKWSSRLDLEQSESVIRSMISERESCARGDGKQSSRTLEYVGSKESFVGPAGKPDSHQLSSLNFIDSKYFNSGAHRSYTPIPTELSDLSPDEYSVSQLPTLLKSRSKKTVLDIRSTVQALACPPDYVECHLEKASMIQEDTPRRSSSSLQEINLALQTILDDLGSDTLPMNAILNDSTKRLECSQMWNIDSPQSSARKSAQDHTMNMLVDLVLESVVEEATRDPLWRKALVKKPLLTLSSSKGDLSEKFKQIDELLNYDDSPVSTKPKKLDEGPDSPLISERRAPAQKYPENILDDNIEEDMEHSGEVQSEAETVYGIRTNFNAVNEYLNLLLKFLKEHMPELSLPVSKHSRTLVLRRIHNLEIELQENAARTESVKTITIPKRPTKKERTAVKCFARQESACALLSATLFTSLEEDILVVAVDSVVVQGHEHPGRAV